MMRPYRSMLTTLESLKGEGRHSFATGSHTWNATP
jgi:hypothetical protein